MEQEKIDEILRLTGRKKDLQDFLAFASDGVLKVVKIKSDLGVSCTEELGFDLRMAMRPLMEDMKKELLDRAKIEIENIDKKLKEL